MRTYFATLLLTCATACASTVANMPDDLGDDVDSGTSSVPDAAGTMPDSRPTSTPDAGHPDALPAQSEASTDGGAPSTADAGSALLDGARGDGGAVMPTGDAGRDARADDPYVVNGIHYNAEIYDGYYDAMGVLHKSTDVPCMPSATQCFRSVTYTDPSTMATGTATIPVVCTPDGAHWAFNTAECSYPHCNVPGLVTSKPIGDCPGGCTLDPNTQKWGCR